MGQAVKDRSEICPLPPGPLKELSRHMRPRTIFIAVSLTLILTTAGLVVLQPPLAIPPPPPPAPLQLTPHSAIEIDGDANFAATALLEGWPGNGTSEDPYIIDGLEIDRGGTGMLCLGISNTRVSFIISNCNLTRAIGYSMSTYWGSGISLHNVSNGAIVNNTCSNNEICGIILRDSDSNILINNYCYNNSVGIGLFDSSSNTVFNNICTNNTIGISLYSEPNTVAYNTVSNNICTNNTIGIELCSLPTQHTVAYNTVSNNICTNNTDFGISLSRSDSNTVANNTCSSNDIGIALYESRYNTISTNTCNDNRIGIELIGETYPNVVVNNTFVGNTEHDIVGEYITEEFDPVLLPDSPALPLSLMLAGIIMLGAVWRMVSLSRRESKGD